MLLRKLQNPFVITFLGCRQTEQGWQMVQELMKTDLRDALRWVVLYALDALYALSLLCPKSCS
jgi:hypothetical protein